MITIGDLARAATTALTRVSSGTTTGESETTCPLDHGVIARAGVEEGLELALRLLREDHRLMPASTPIGEGNGRSGDLMCPPIVASNSPDRR